SMAQSRAHASVHSPISPGRSRAQPLPIGESQTISQPYIVAYMTEVIDPKPGQKVLEVGTGSGYQAAVLAELVGEVYTIELLPKLAETAQKRLERLGRPNLQRKGGGGTPAAPATT